MEHDKAEIAELLRDTADVIEKVGLIAYDRHERGHFGSEYSGPSTNLPSGRVCALGGFERVVGTWVENSALAMQAVHELGQAVSPVQYRNSDGRVLVANWSNEIAMRPSDALTDPSKAAMVASKMREVAEQLEAVPV